MNILKDISLKQFNTFGIEVYSKYFSRFSSVSELKELIASPIMGVTAATIPLVILGGGSNMLFTRSVDGLVLKNEIKGIEKVDEDDEYLHIKVGAGENWHQFVMHCINNNYAGVENLALIPGNVGASPMQNIGAYGVEIKDVFHSLQAYHIKDHSLVTFNKSDCAFGYRESVFKNKFKEQFIITDVIFKLRKTAALNISYGAIKQELELMHVAAPDIRSVAQAVMNIRSSKLPDPAVIGNAGSFFKNPEIDAGLFNSLKERFPAIVGYQLESGAVKLAAGWLIEQCGWKGYRKGDAGCHAKQALVLVNYGNATGKEIYDLSTEILKTVNDKFGVQLEREVNIL